MYRLGIFLNDREAVVQKYLANMKCHVIRSQVVLVFRENMTHWKFFHLDDKGGEAQELYNGFESNSVQSINMKIQKERNKCR